MKTARVMQTVRGSQPVAGGQLRLDIALSAVPISRLKF
jgi:hypothetical protein